MLKNLKIKTKVIALVSLVIFLITITLGMVSYQRASRLLFNTFLDLTVHSVVMLKQLLNTGLTLLISIY